MEPGVNKTRVSRRHRLARRRLGAKWSSHVPAAGERQVWRRARAGRGEQGRRQEPRGSRVTRTAPFWLPSRLRLPPAGSRHGLQKEAPHMRCFTAPLPHHGRACASACLGGGPRDTGTPGGQPPLLLASASRQHPARGLGEPSASRSEPPHVCRHDGSRQERAHWSWAGLRAGRPPNTQKLCQEIQRHKAPRMSVRLLCERFLFVCWRPDFLPPSLLVLSF